MRSLVKITVSDGRRLPRISRVGLKPECSTSVPAAMIPQSHQVVPEDASQPAARLETREVVGSLWDSLESEF